MDTGEGEQTNRWTTRNAPTAFQLGARLARRPKRAMSLQVAMLPVRFEKSRVSSVSCRCCTWGEVWSSALACRSEGFRSLTGCVCETWILGSYRPAEWNCLFASLGNGMAMCIQDADQWGPQYAIGFSLSPQAHLDQLEVA